jgi:hypothetical protein
MGDEDRSLALPQRKPSTARAGPTPPARPALSEQLRQHMQVAVKAERAPTAGQDHDHKPATAVSAGTDQSAPPQASVRREKEPGRLRFARSRMVAAALVVTAIVAGSLAIAVNTHTASSPGYSRTASVSPQLQQVAARDQAATWVAQQVNQDAIVSCDRVMCSALAADGFPSRNLRVLGPTSPFPASSAVVVVTAAVRDLFGSSLSSSWAPAVIATFGSGNAQITVRVIAPHGAAAYQAALSADLQARKASGAELLSANPIIFSAAAREQLITGQVDPRLLLEIAALAADQPIDILQFGNIGPGAGAGIPLRFAELAENDQAAHMDSSAYVRSILAYLGAVPTQFPPPSTKTVVLPGGQAVLRIEFTAPSPLGLLSPPQSS